MRLKLDNSRARGYCGWHLSWDRKQVFLRSMGEYVVACMLDAQKIAYLTEVKTFEINCIRYKPDFFIYADNSYTRLVKIIEVKSQGDKSSHDFYIASFKSAFNSIGIEYEVIFRFDKLKTSYCPIEKQNQWKKHSESTTNSESVAGKLNPMFGVKHKDSTKSIIGAKAKLRFENVDYKNNQIEKMKQFYKTEKGEKLKHRLANLRVAEAQARKNKYLELPLITSFCKQCGREIRSREFVDLCSSKCIKTWSYKNVSGYGKHKDPLVSGRKRIWTYLNIIISGLEISIDDLVNNLQQFVNEAKFKKIIPKNKGLSKATLLKFKVIEEQENGKIKINYD